MKKHCSVILAHAALLAASLGHAQTAIRWDFDGNGDTEHWVAAARGVVAGGAIWLTLAPRESNPERIAKPSYQWLGDGNPGADLLTSPAGLHLPAQSVTQVRLRVLNLSSLTDFLLKWRTRETEWGSEAPGAGQPAQQARRCTMKADIKEWQEVVCYIDRRWSGTIEQIAIARSAQRAMRGDLWIDWIEIRKDAPEPIRERPDVASRRVVPRIAIPKLSQEGFAEAFEVLDRCLTTDVPIYGFNYPVMSPGGYYTAGGWWQLDSSLALTGAKWANTRFAENVMRGFAEVQDPDGRIDLAGFFWIRGQVADLSSLPKYLEVAYDIARRTPDRALRGQIYESMRRYLEWWLSPVKRDARTGLISGIGEETFGDRWQAPHLKFDTLDIEPMTLAPVDLNVVVAVGAMNAARLAAALDRPAEADRFRRAFADLSRAINTYMWDESAGAYYNYDLRKGQRLPALNVTIFDPLRLAIAAPARRDRLLKRLLDPGQFNWGRRPLTSWARTEPGFVEARGHYDGRAWFGDIWTLRNMVVVAGLGESGRPDLAARLNWATIRTFHANYREFALPSTGEGQGAENYAWTASQYIGAIVEHLFGIDYDAIDKTVRIAPLIPEELYGKEIRLTDLLLPTSRDARLSVRIRQSSPSTAAIKAEITGELPDGELVVMLPGTGQQRRVRMTPAYATEF